MINKNKVILSSIIVTIICLTLNVKAITLTTDSTKKSTTDTNSYLVTNTGSLTISNLTVETQGDKDFVAIKILDTFYNSSTNEVTYEFTTYFQKYFLNYSNTYKDLTVDDYLKLTSGDITTGSVVTNSTLDKLLNSFKEYVKYKSDHEGLTSSYCKINSAECKFTNLTAGAYLVGPTQEFNKAFAIMLGNVTPIASNGEWTIDEPTIVAKESDAFSIKAYVNKTGNTTGVFGVADFSLIFDISVPELPNTTEEFTIGGNSKWNFFDGGWTAGHSCGATLFCVKDLHLKLNEETLSITQNDSDNLYYSAEIRNAAGELIGKVNSGHITLYAKYISSKQISIEYKLTYSQAHSKYDTTEYSFNLNSVDGFRNYAIFVNSNAITLYSYTLGILAYEKGDKTKLLNGLIFDVYSDEALTNKIDTITTDDKGTTGIDRLGEGTFYLKQTKTKTGYSLLKPFSITLDSTNSQPNETTTFEIQIPKAGILPVTGGAGIIIYIVLGLAIIVGAVVGFIYYNKKKEKNNKEKEEN